jgi:hypothetical protein
MLSDTLYEAHAVIMRHLAEPNSKYLADPVLVKRVCALLDEMQAIVNVLDTPPSQEDIARQRDLREVNEE